MTGSSRASSKTPLEFWIAAPFFIEKIKDQALLFSIEGNDTQSQPVVLWQLEPLVQPTHRRADNGACFHLIGPAPAAPVDTVDLMQPYCFGFCCW